MATKEKKYIKDIDSEVKSDNILKLNDIVTLKSHPYQFKYFEPNISAYAHFTPPIMIVVEILIKSTYSASTGIKEANQYKCLFYSTKEGKFLEIWFKEDELKYIDNYITQFDFDGSNFGNWKKNLIGTEVVLHTVDLELGKKKVFLDTTDSKSKVKSSNLLDYLPPVATVLDIKYDSDTFNPKSGEKISSKLQVEAKIKWLNNESGKFSEATIPLNCLKKVDFNESFIRYKVNSTYLYPLKNKIGLEDNPTLYYKAVPLILKSTTFNHYYYSYESNSAFSGGFSSFSRTFPVTKTVDLNALINDGISIDKTLFDLKKENQYKAKWCHLQYRDRNGTYSERIVFIKNIMSDPKLSEQLIAGNSAEGKLILECNCLLRKGKIRHFVVERIEACKVLPSEFEDIFFSKE